MFDPHFDRLRDDITACRLCVEKPLGAPLPHEPRPVCIMSSAARIAICGQAPGNRVNQSGIPFDDPSGDRLRAWLGVDREAFYNPLHFAIVPMGFCFPGYDKKGGDLPPRKECRATWHDAVFKAMPQIELTLVIGQYARDYHLPDYRKSSLTEMVKSWREIYKPDASKRFLPLPHPSWRNTGWLKKNPWFEIEILPVLQQEVKNLTRC